MARILIAEDEDSLRVLVARALIHDVVTKPFSLTTIREVVNDALAEEGRRPH